MTAARAVRPELNTDSLQPARLGARLPLPISPVETSKVSSRLLGAACSREIFALPACSLLRHPAILSAIDQISRAAFTRFMTAAASLGVSTPRAQAVRTAREASTKSPAVSIGGRSNMTGRSRRAGNSRSKQKRSAARSPASACATSTRPRSAAAASMMASRASVAFLRAPLGRPLRRRPEGGASAFSPSDRVAPAAETRSPMASIPPHLSAAAKRRHRDPSAVGPILSSTAVLSTA
jgi:hypothetical protein